MRQDITATSGAPSSSASRGHTMDTESRQSRKRAADVQTEDSEVNEQLDADESAASLPQAEEEFSDERMFIGSWERVESETHNQRLGDKVARDGYLGTDECMDVTTVNERCAMGFHKRGDEESSVQEDSCGKTILAQWSASLCQLETEIERELESHDTERERLRAA